MYMLDTNTCIFVQKNVPIVLDRLKAALSYGVTISAITLAELEHGVAKSAYPERTTAALFRFLSLVEILPFDAQAASEYGHVVASLQRRGTPIGAMDTLIAAHALSLNLTLVTNNTREFQRVEHLALNDWLL